MKAELLVLCLCLVQIASTKTVTTTLSFAEAAAEFHRKVKEYEDGIRKTDSSSVVSIESVETESKIDWKKFTLDEIKTTTFHPEFQKGVRKPKGFYRNALKKKNISVVTAEPIQTQQDTQGQSTRSEITLSQTKKTPQVKSSQSPSSQGTSSPSERSKVTSDVSERSQVISNPSERSEIISNPSERSEVSSDPSQKTTITYSTPWKITPYPDYNSAQERGLWTEWPHREHMWRMRKTSIYNAMFNITVSYSEESVPSSCNCHSGNWSESYDFAEKWRQKECKPMFLNYEAYGNRRRSKRKRKRHSSYSSSEYSEESSQSRHKGKKSRRQPFMHHAPPPYAMGYPYYAPPMAYPPPYAPYHYPPPPPQPVANHFSQDLTNQNLLKEIHEELKNLKKTTKSLWEQYLELKSKFETKTEDSITTVSRQERFFQYRKMERQEPFYSKFKPNGLDQPNPDIPGRKYFNNDNLNFNRPAPSPEYQRPYFEQRFRPYPTAEPNKEHQPRTVPSHQPEQRITDRSTVRFRPWELHLTDVTPRITQRPTIPPQRSTSRSEMSSRTFENPTRATFVRSVYVTAATRTYARRTADTTRWSVAASTRRETSTFQAQTKLGETENPIEAYKRYKEKYEFPDYLAQKRRLSRAEDRKMRRKLYEARGMVYDEEPPRITTWPPTQPPLGSTTFDNWEQYFKYMFDDRSLSIDTTTVQINKAPTFNFDTDKGKMEYLKWMFGDRSLSLDLPE